MEFDLSWIHYLLISWYKEHHRDLRWRATKNPYEIWISEIMLQQTRVDAVKGYYNRFLDRLPSIDNLANVSEDELLKLWEGLGYYNRARNLKKAAMLIVEKYNGMFPNSYDDILALPGIGAYTAGAICSICYDLPTPAVDGNVLRVIMRLENCYDVIDEEKTKRKVRNQLEAIYKIGDCGLLTQSLMELGAMICIPNGRPKCEECPLAKGCVAYQKNTYSELPVRKEKKARKIIEKTVFVLHDNDCYGIRKREDKGLLANMWEFLQIDEKMDASKAVQYISEQGFSPVAIEKEIPYTHIFSHVEWRMTAYYITCRNLKQELLWVDREALEKQYALPTAFRYFLEKES